MVRSVPPQRQVVAALAMACTSACSANVHLRDGRSISAPVERSESGAVYLRQADGSQLRIDSGSVEDIDHPGNVVAALSPLTMFLFMGGAAMSSFGPKADDGAPRGLLITGIALSSVMFVGGIGVWARSRVAAGDMYDEPTRP